MLLALTFLLSGTIKGAVGLGLPTTALAILTLTFDPRTAIAVLLVPIVASNLWQVWRAGDVLAAVRRYAPFATCLMVGVAVVLTLTADISARLLEGLIGGAILIFVAVNATPLAPVIPDSRDRAAQIAFGTFGGIIGGLTSLWAPAMMIYLAARRVPKDEFVRATGILILLGCIPLVWGYVREGFLTRDIALVSALMVAPAIAGFSLGEALRGRLSEAAFRKALLVFFALVGLNMVRRALLV